MTALPARPIITNNTATNDACTVRVWAILSDVLPPLPPKTISYNNTPPIEPNRNAELRQKPRMVFKTLKQNATVKEESDTVRVRFLDPSPGDVVTSYILNKSEHLPISHNLIYNLVLRVSTRNSSKPNGSNAGEAQANPRAQTSAPPKHGSGSGQRIRRGSSNRYPVFDDHGTIGVSSSTANETRNYDYALVVPPSSVNLYESSASLELIYPLITPRMIRNEKVMVPLTQIARVALTEILMNTFMSMRTGCFSEQSLARGGITEERIQDLENTYGIPLELGTHPMNMTTICKPTHGLFACGPLIDPRSNQCTQILDWINLNIKVTAPKNLMLMVRDQNTCGSLSFFVIEELENAQELDIILAMLSNWFKYFKTLEQRTVELTIQPRISIPWFNATLGHTRRARMVFNCARSHPLLFVQLEVLSIKQQVTPPAPGTLDRQDSTRDDAASFYSISLLEWLPHMKHGAFVLKDLYMNTPFFTSTSSVISCIDNLRTAMSGSVNANDIDTKEKGKAKIQDLLMLEALNVGIRFVKHLFSTNSDIAYKLPSTVRYNHDPPPTHIQPEYEYLFRGSPVLDVVIETLLTTPPLNYSYIHDITPSGSIAETQVSLSSSSYGMPPKLYGANNRRTAENLFLLKSPGTTEWFNLPPIIKTVNEVIPGVTYYQPREQYIAKSTILNHIRALYSRVSQSPKREPGYAAGATVLTREQQCALDSIDTTPITMIVGGPGVGKTFVAKEIFKKYGLVQTRLMAYTGALVSHLRTVISGCLEEIRDRDMDSPQSLDITNIVHMVHEHYITKYKNPTTRDTRAPFGYTAPVRVVIIDEVPMFDNRTLAMALSLYTESQTRLVFLADENQIGSIGLGTVFKQFREYYQEQQENRVLSVEPNVSPTPLLGMCTLTENFRQSKTSSCKDLKELATLYNRGRSELLFDFNQLTAEQTGGLESCSGGVHFIKLPVSDTLSSSEAIKDIVTKYFFMGSQNPMHLITTMFLTFTRTTRTQVNTTVSSIIMRSLIPGAIAPAETALNNQTTSAEETTVYFVGQRVMVEGKNFHGKHIHPSLHLFNGEVYTVGEIAALSLSLPAEKEQTPQLGIAERINRATENTRKYDYVTKQTGSSYFKLNDSKKKGDSVVVESFIIKLQGWPISTARPYKYIIITSRPATVLLPDQVPLFGLCPIMERHHLVESWAMTVNKAQGCEFGKVCLIIQNGTEETKYFSAGHGLVAISRAKEEFTLVANASDALDKMKNLGSGSLFPTKQNTEAISDLKTYLLSPSAPWVSQASPDGTPTLQGMKRSRASNI